MHLVCFSAPQIVCILHVFCGITELSSTEAPLSQTLTTHHYENCRCKRACLNQVASLIFFFFFFRETEHAGSDKALLLVPQINCKWVFAERSQALPTQRTGPAEM